MLKNRIKRASAMLLAGLLTVQPACVSALFGPGSGAQRLFGTMTSYAAGWQGIVKADSLNVRSGPGTGYSAVGKLANNTNVTVTGETTGEDGQRWYQISYGNGKSGYARHDFITQPVVYSASDAGFEAWMNEQGFPESYKNGLRGLHQQYPNWIFKAQHTGLDWNTVIAEESKVGRNLVDRGSISSWKSTAQGAFDWAANSWPGFDGASWQAASTEIISHYMDPRNFLSEPYIFQFELQSYDPQVHTKDGLAKLVEGSFLAGDAVVPLEGSQVEGGTIVEVAVGGGSSSGTGGGASSPSGNSSGGSGTVYGPSQTGPDGSSADDLTGPGIGLEPDGGGSSSGSSESTAPTGGAASGNGTAPSNGANASGGNGPLPGGGAEQSGVSFVGPSAAIDLSWLTEPFRELFLGFEAYAGSWNHISQSPDQWTYTGDDGTLLVGWHWLDGNQDGVAECYYFYENGIMASSTEIEGYLVDADGRWISHSGTVYTKQASGAGSGGNAGSTATVKMKKIPYVDILMKAAETSGVSPYVLASMIIQEQGKNGGSDLISGTHSKYPGYYNFYNIGAYAHDGMGAVEAGLKYASESGNGSRPWDNIEKALIGGANAYGANYVQKGQDTFYLKKYNVQGDNLYNHQYMTNVPAAAAEGAKISKAYNSDIKSTALEFKIPVYTSMPENPCPMPAVDGNPNNKLRSLGVEGYTLTPTYNMDVNSYELIVDGTVSSVNIGAQTIDANASVSGSGTVALNTGLNQIRVQVTAQNGDVREYLINITRREGGGDPSGGGLPPAGGAGPSGPSPDGSMPQGGSGPSAGGPSDGNVVIIG